MSYHNLKLKVQDLESPLDQVIEEAASAEIQARDAICKIRGEERNKSVANGWEQAPIPRYVNFCLCPSCSTSSDDQSDCIGCPSCG